MKLPWKDDEKDTPQVEQEFARSVADEPKQETDRDPLDRDRHYGGEPLLDAQTEVDPKAESAEWERRYGTEESRDKLGFDGE
jgi:hypothetical protein